MRFDIDEKLLFVQTPDSLLCKLCNEILLQALIIPCGHTFCEKCVVNLPANEGCPVHKHGGVNVQQCIPNILIEEQIEKLETRCKYGVIIEKDKVVPDPEGCPQILKYSELEEHHNSCLYKLVPCSNSEDCGMIRRKHLAKHLEICPNKQCQYKGCDFRGTQKEINKHEVTCSRLDDAQFKTPDDKIKSLERRLRLKTQEVQEQKQTISELCIRLESLETTLIKRFDTLDRNVQTMGDNLQDTLSEFQLMKVQIAESKGPALPLQDKLHQYKCKGTFVGHQLPVWSLEIGGEFLYSGSQDGTVKVWDHSSGRCVGTLSGHDGMVQDLCCFGNYLFSASWDCTIMVWDRDKMRSVMTIRGHDNLVCALTVARGMLFSGSCQIIKVWDVKTLKHKADLCPQKKYWVRALAANDKFLFSGSFKQVDIWSLDSLKLHTTLGFREGYVYSLAVSTKYLICGTYDSFVHLWDINTFEMVETLGGHLGSVYALLVNSYGGHERLFSASYDTTVNVWNLETLKCVQTLARHVSSVNTLAAVGGIVFSGADDNTIRVWQ